MVNPNFPIPFISITTTTGVYPLPVAYGDDGYTAVTVKVTNAVADNLTVFTMSGTSAVAVPVASTAGDETQTAADISAAVNAGFTGTSRLGMVSISREYSSLEPQYPYPDGFSVVTFSGATAAVVVNTRLVIQEEGVTTDGTYLLLDAARPFNPALPTPQVNAGYVSTQFPISITEGMYLWIPELGTMHKITRMKAGGYGQGATYKDIGFHVRLDPVPATAAGELYAVLPFNVMRRKCRVKNVGAASATVDGQTLAAGQEISYDAREKPFVYDCSATTLNFVFDGL